MNQNTDTTAQFLYNISITAINHEGQGIAKIDNKTVFVDQAVPGDVANIKITEMGEKFDRAQITELKSASEQRAEPFCPHYQSCGGCQLQHINIDAQREWKNQNFITRLTKAVNSKFVKISEPITGDDQNYRRRARLGLAISKKDKQARLGFRQKQSNELIDIEHCPVLTTELNQNIADNRAQLLELASRSYKEVNIVEADNGCFIHMDKQDAEFLQNNETPNYQVDDLNLNFPADGFVQVNAQINQQMVSQAIKWLEISNKHKVLDLFCGVGNFTLPIAKQAKTVVGIEGLMELVQTAQTNAQTNQLDNTEFYKANLFEECENSVWFRQQKYQRILLDPGRQGAFEISKKIHLLKPEVIVYVSCNAATLIRDIKEMEKQGYLLHKACLMDMFPHTTHTEVMVQLKKTKQPKKRDRKVFKF